MFSHLQSGRKRGIPQSEYSDGEDQQVTSRCPKNRRLNITAPPSLPPFCTFFDPLSVNPSSMPSFTSSNLPLKPDSPRRSTTPNQAMRYENFLSRHTPTIDEAQSHSSIPGSLPNSWMTPAYMRNQGRIHYENMPACSAPFSSSRCTSLRTILAVSKSKEFPSQLSHLEACQSTLKNRVPTKYALADLGQALARLCTVDELDELTPTSESEPMIPDSSFDDLSLSS